MFACGEEAGDWLYGKKNRDKVIIMKNAIDANAYRYNEAVQDDMRKQLGLTNKKVIGHVGRFFPQKNHEFLIDIFDAIHKKEPDTALVLVGGGETDDVLKNHIKEKVAKLGLTDSVKFLGVRDDVEKVVQTFDVFLLPSLFEGLPVTMVEAQAAGLPCVISDRVPVECDITGNVTVVTLDETPEKWADVVINQTNNFEKKDTYSQIVDAGFDIKAQAVWLEEFYRKALEENGFKLSEN